MSPAVKTPLYQILINDLKKQIDEGIFKKGDLLPSENELCKTYNTTRPTVRKALSELVNSNHIVRHHGKGSIVAEPKTGLGILSLKGVTAGSTGFNLKTTILEKPIRKAWPDNFPFELSEEETIKGTIYFSRLRYINDYPVLYEETFITDYKLPRFTMRNLEKNSLFEVLRKHYKVEIKEGEQKIWAVEASGKIGDLLKVSAGKPLLELKRKLITNTENLHIYSFVYCNTQDYFIQGSF